MRFSVVPLGPKSSSNQHRSGSEETLGCVFLCRGEGGCRCSSAFGSERERGSEQVMSQVQYVNPQLSSALSSHSHIFVEAQFLSSSWGDTGWVWEIVLLLLPPPSSCSLHPSIPAVLGTVSGQPQSLFLLFLLSGLNNEAVSAE